MTTTLPSATFLLLSSIFTIGSFGLDMGVAAETKFHVLAVDDSVIDRKLIERLLRTSSFQVTAVDSGSKALEFLGLNGEEHEDDAETPSVSSSCNSNDSEVSLIITDYFMPGMTGYDLMRRIKGSRSCRDIPVVIMSSENVPSRINQCLRDGAEEFFLKPVRLSDVKKLRPRLLEERSHGRGVGGDQRTRGDYSSAVL